MIFEHVSNIMLAADQTPTPTRFIRSCEEVGLFQDLHNDNDNDNPFEETFRRAVEAGKSCILSVPEVIYYKLSFTFFYSC